MRGPLLLNPNPGWYQDPSEAGLERYWNGESWGNETRPGHPQVKTLGILLFRSPIKSDWVFISYLVILGLSLISMVAQEGDLIAPKNFFPLVFLVIISILWIYVLFLVLLIPRRILDRRKGLRKPAPLFPGPKLSDPWNSVKPKRKKSDALYLALALGLIGFLLLGVKSLSADNEVTFASTSDNWFAEEQRISVILREWNNAALPVMEAIRGLSNGTMGRVEALEKVTTAQPQVTGILEKLRVECADIPRGDLGESAEAAAVSKAWLMLTETCDAIPQQWIETIAIYRAQVDDRYSQEDIDFHVSELNALGEKRRVAVKNAIEAMLPYASESEREILLRMKKLVQD